MGAVFGGLILIIVFSTVTDIVLHSAGFFPPWGQPVPNAPLVFATIYRTIYSVAGAYLTARLAPANPLKHGLILGAIGIVLGIIGAAATWNAGPAFGAHWYPVALVILALPQCWLGAKLYARKQHAPATAQ